MNETQTTSIDQKITALKAGQSFRMGGNKNVWTTCERSGNGKLIRFVRHTPNTSVVFHTVNA